MQKQRAASNATSNYPYGMPGSKWKQYNWTSRVDDKKLKEFEGKVGAIMSIAAPSLPKEMTGEAANAFATGFRTTQRRAFAGNKRARKAFLDFNESVNEMKAEAIEMALMGTRSKAISAELRSKADDAADTYRTISSNQNAAKNLDDRLRHHLKLVKGSWILGEKEKRIPK